MSAHTATPWHRDGFCMSDLLECTCPKGHPDARHLTGDFVKLAQFEGPNWHANAGFALKAVNSHARLVDLLRRAREFVEIDATGDDDNGGTALLGDIDAVLAEVSA
jgi:hypothetical protein